MLLTIEVRKTRLAKPVAVADQAASAIHCLTGQAVLPDRLMDPPPLLDKKEQFV